MRGRYDFRAVGAGVSALPAAGATAGAAPEAEDAVGTSAGTLPSILVNSLGALGPGTMGCPQGFAPNTPSAGVSAGVSLNTGAGAAEAAGAPEPFGDPKTGAGGVTGKGLGIGVAPNDGAGGTAAEALGKTGGVSGADLSADGARRDAPDVSASSLTALAPNR